MRNVLSALMLSVALAASAHLTAQCNQNCPDKHSISVTASGSVTVDADLAIVHVGYKLYAADARSAYASATDTSNAIMSALTGKGIASGDIESTSQALQRTQPYELNQYPINSVDREHHQYVVTQQWTARVKPNEAAKTLDAAITAGANESGSIEWAVRDPTRAEAEASAKAMANAHTIAAQIAETAVVHLGALLSANDNQQNMPVGRNFAMLANFAGPMPQSNEPLAINSRRVEFKSTITASFAIE